MTMNSEQSRKALDRLESQFEKEIIRNYEVALKEIRGKIAESYAKYDGSWIEMQKYNRLTKLEEQIAEEIAKLTGKNAMTLKKGNRHMYAESYYHTAYILSNDVNADLGFALLDTKEIERAIENPLDRVGMLQRNRDNQRRLTRQLREHLAQGLIQGESYRSTAKRIRERMEIGANNALTIARTENNRIRNKAGQDSMEKAQESGLIIKKVWVAAGQSDRTREDHLAADGQERRVDEPFDVGGEDLMHPGDPLGSSEQVVNCRCSMLTIPEGFESNARATQNVTFNSYDDFKGNLK